MIQGTELDALIKSLLDNYVSHNRAAQTLCHALNGIGIGLLPVVDHITIRTRKIDQRAEEFIERGYIYSETLYYEDWYAKVYRAPGYPALFIDQAYADLRGKTSIIPGWVAKFGDQTLHHIAVHVEDIARAIQWLEAQSVAFTGKIVGEPGSDLRQIFTSPEIVEGEPFSVLELTERHRGFQGFSPPQADSLMQSTVKNL